MSMIVCPFCHTRVWVGENGTCPSCSTAVSMVSLDGQTTVPQIGPCDFCNNEKPDVNRCFVVKNDRDFSTIVLLGLGGLLGALFAKKAGGYVQCKSCESCTAASQRIANSRVKLYAVLFFWSVMGLLLIGSSLAWLGDKPHVWQKLLVQISLGLYLIGWFGWLRFVHRYVQRAIPQLLGSEQDQRLKNLFQITQWGSVAVDLHRNQPTGSSRIPTE